MTLDADVSESAAATEQASARIVEQTLNSFIFLRSALEADVNV